MSSPLQTKGAAEQLQMTLLLMGGAMLSSLVIYAVVAWHVSQAERHAASDTWMKAHTALLGLAVLVAVLGMMLEKKLRPQPTAGAGFPASTQQIAVSDAQAAPDIQRYVQAFLIPLVCYETVAIFGLLLVFLGMGFREFLCWVGASIALQVALALPKIPQYVDEVRRVELRSELSAEDDAGGSEDSRESW